MSIYQRLLFVFLLGTTHRGVADDSATALQRIDPDRSDFTSGTSIVPLGELQVEGGADWERGRLERDISIGDVTVRIPVSTTVELRLGLPPYLVIDQGDHKTGLDDSTFEARWQFYHGPSLHLALQIMSTLPTGSHVVAEHDWQPGGSLAASLKITETIQWVTSVGGNRATAEGKRFSQALASTSFRVDVAPCWRLLAEAYVYNRESADGAAHRYADIGAVYFLGENTALDARIGKGIHNGGDINTFASAGLSHRF